MSVRLFLPIVALCLLAGVVAVPAGLRAQTGEPNTQNIGITRGNASPSVVQVPVGASIRWVNNDTKVHELVLKFDDGFVLPLPDLEPGADFTMAFTDAESLLFRSVNDPGVRGTITIGTRAPIATNTLAPSANAPLPAATVFDPPGPEATATATRTIVAIGTTEAVSVGISTVSPTDEVVPATPIPTPPPPEAGGLGLVADRSRVGVLWLGFLGAAVMALAASSLLLSGSRKRITVERRR